MSWSTILWLKEATEAKHCNEKQKKKEEEEKEEGEEEGDVEVDEEGVIGPCWRWYAQKHAVCEHDERTKKGACDGTGDAVAL